MTPELIAQYKELKEICTRIEKQAFQEAIIAQLKGNETIMLRWSIPHNAKDALGRPLPSFTSVALTEEQARALLELAQCK